MKKILFYIAIFFTMISFGQVTNYNQFPSMSPLHILDEKLENISFAFSMRLLESDYNGPLIKLRRASDNSLKDFEIGDNDIVDFNAIEAWRGSNAVYIHTWYDQSGLGRDAIQEIDANQPQFYPDPIKPYFKGDGSNDHLTVDTPNGIQDVTNNGSEGTVITILTATKKNQHTFGVLVGSNRWSTHINWSNNNVYFDPGYCCNNPRSFANSGNVDQWAIYTFIKNKTNAIGRSSGVERFNGTHTSGTCTRTEDFAIGWATGGTASSHSTSSFIELIMYKSDIADYQEIEDNAITFWNL